MTYTPSTGFSGSDSFAFTTTNTAGLTSNPATVSLTVVGQATISSISPASGAPGTLVTITGTNLQTVGSVRFFRNVTGTGLTTYSTQVTVRVPAGATTGPVTVVSGSSSVNSGVKFVVTAQ